jgi:hypothetical protein
MIWVNRQDSYAAQMRIAVNWLEVNSSGAGVRVGYECAVKRELGRAL